MLLHPCGVVVVTTEAYVKCVGETLYQNLNADNLLAREACRQLKKGVVCLLASETVLGVDNAKSGICYIYMYGWHVCS